MNSLLEMLFPNPYGNAVDPIMQDQLRRQSLLQLGAGMISSPSIRSLFPLLADVSGQYQSGLGQSYNIALERAERQRKAAAEERRIRVSERNADVSERNSEASIADREFDNQLALQKYLDEVREATQTKEGTQRWLESIKNPEHRAFAETMLQGGGDIDSIAGRIFDLQNPKPRAPIQRSSGQASWLENYVTDDTGKVVGVEPIPGSRVQQLARPSTAKENKPTRSYEPANPNITPSMLNSKINELMRVDPDDVNAKPLSREEATRRAQEELEEFARLSTEMHARRNAEKIRRDLSDPKISETIPASEYVTLYLMAIADSSDRQTLTQLRQTKSDEEIVAIIKQAEGW